MVAALVVEVSAEAETAASADFLAEVVPLEAVGPVGHGDAH